MGLTERKTNDVFCTRVPSPLVCKNDRRGIGGMACEAHGELGRRQLSKLASAATIPGTVPINGAAPGMGVSVWLSSPRRLALILRTLERLSSSLGITRLQGE